MDLISVIVPVYNVEQYLNRCVDSILKQSYQNLEIILVDDGSPDRCPELCEQIKAMDDRVKVVHKENGGLGFARNSGLEVVTGTYVTFIDSDDWISENHIENLYHEAKQSSADVVIGSHTVALADGSMQTRSVGLQPGIYKQDDITDKILLPLIGADVSNPQDIELTSSSCMNLYKVSLIKNHQLQFRSEKVAVAEDLYFNIDCFAHAECVAVVNETGYYYFENVASISRRYDPKRFERTICFYDVLRGQIQQYGLESKVSWRAERSFLMKIRVTLLLLVSAKLPRKQTYQEIRRILNHQLVKKVLSEYPLDTFVPAMRLLAKWMRNCNVRRVYWLIRVRGYAKETKWLKNIVKRMGIGQ
jgi:glycosyltransferase involved in cell wall biosynthesis